MKIIEAVILFPMTILIAVYMIYFMMNLYNDFEAEIDRHSEAREAMYETSEVYGISAYDKFDGWLEK